MYYHEVKLISFNWWLIVFIVTVVIMIVLGRKQYIMKKMKGRYRILKVIDDRIFSTLTFVSTFLFGILFITESGRGFLQLFDNSLAPGESPVYSVVMAAIIYPFILLIYGFVVSEVGRISGNLKYLDLTDQRRELIRQQMRSDNSDPWV
jgi:hypothetical protein